MLLIFAAFLALVLVPSCAQPLHENDKPSKALLAICESTGLKHDGTLAGINKAAQNPETGWLRKPGQERWMMEAQWEEKRSEILPNLDACGLVQAKQPQEKAYTYLFESGALQSRMKKRIDFAAELIQNSTIKIDDRCVLFTGSRPTDPTREDNKFAKTEAEAMEAIYQQSPLYNTLPYELINAPMKQDAKGNAVRPTTEDPIQLWLATNPAHGSALIISDQPFLTRQALVYETLLPAGFKLDSAGEAASFDLPIAVYLDELARTIYQIILKEKKVSSEQEKKESNGK